MYSTAVCEPFCRIPDTNGRRVHRHLEDLGALNSCRASRRIETVGTDRHVQGQIDSVLGFSVRCCAIVEALWLDDGAKTVPDDRTADNLAKQLYAAGYEEPESLRWIERKEALQLGLTESEWRSLTRLPPPPPPRERDEL